MKGSNTVEAVGCAKQRADKEYLAFSDYTTLTLDYPISAAKAFAKLSDPFKFVYISGEGANPAGTGVLFARVKGRAETALLQLSSSHPSLKVYNVRPAYIDPGDNFLAERPRAMVDRIANLLAPVARTLTPSYVSPTDKLAEVLVELAIGDGTPVAGGNGVEAGGRTLRNVALRRMERV